MKAIILTFFVLMAGSSVFSAQMSDVKYQGEDCSKVASRITKIYSDQMFQEKQLITVGTGGGGVGKLRMLSVSFRLYQMYDLQQARSFLVECVEKYLNIINRHPELERFSQTFPYTNQNVDVSIAFVGINSGDFIPHPFIAYACAKEGKLFYGTYENEKLNTIQQETYEEALEKDRN